MSEEELELLENRITGDIHNQVKDIDNVSDK